MNIKKQAMNTLILFFSVFTAFGMVSADQNLGAITKAIGAGDTATLSRYLDQTIDLEILGRSDTYDKAEAVKLLSQFFSQHPPKSFAQVHQGTSKGGDALYCIGNLTTSGGVFRVYIYVKDSGGQDVIQELSFNKE